MWRVVATAVVLAVVAGCGGGDEEAAPAAWCEVTGQIVYMLDQHSTTLTYDTLRDWEDGAPEDIRAATADFGAALRRYPVDADAPDLVAARADVEAYAADRCPEGWEGPNRVSEG